MSEWNDAIEKAAQLIERRDIVAGHCLAGDIRELKRDEPENKMPGPLKEDIALFLEQCASRLEDAMSVIVADCDHDEDDLASEKAFIKDVRDFAAHVRADAPPADLVTKKPWVGSYTFAKSRKPRIGNIVHVMVLTGRSALSIRPAIVTRVGPARVIQKDEGQIAVQVFFAPEDHPMQLKTLELYEAPENEWKENTWRWPPNE
jgi:hypothetical protein